LLQASLVDETNFSFYSLARVDASALHVSHLAYVCGSIGYTCVVSAVQTGGCFEYRTNKYFYMYMYSGIIVAERTTIRSRRQQSQLVRRTFCATCSSTGLEVVALCPGSLSPRGTGGSDKPIMFPTLPHSCSPPPLGPSDSRSR